MRDSQEFIDAFLSDRERGKKPRGREKAVPELLDGLSMYSSAEAAEGVWADVADRAQARGEEPRIGRYLAVLRLEPGTNVEDLHELGGHIYVWGEPQRLAAMVVDVYALSRRG